MRLSLSNKLFAGFALLSLLTILLGVTTVTDIKRMTESQKDIGVIQEFGLRVAALEAAITAQSNAFVISMKAYDDFRSNLEVTTKLASKILISEHCSAPQVTSKTDLPDSCQSVMIEAIDSYPQAVIKHYEKTLFTLRLINKNRFIYKKMLEATDRLPQNPDRQLVTTIIHHLEMLKHDFEESNDSESIGKMRTELQLLQKLRPGFNTTKLAKTFIDNSAQTHLNRQKIASSMKVLAESTKRFSKTSKVLYANIVEKSLNNKRQIRALITFLSLTSAALTFLFWFLTSRRLARFLNNQRRAINSIKSGNYDYTFTKDTDDELTALCDFTKTIAINLKDEIGERKSSQQEKESLQSQLVQSQRLESIGRLAGGIAHDFNNIMTGITGYTDLALARLEDDHPAKRYLKIISESGQKARDITRQLQAFSKKQELHKQVINLGTLISNFSKMMGRIIGDNIVFEFTTTPDLPNVMADPAQIEQVLINMAVNAKDAMPSGGTLSIKTSEIIFNELAVEHIKDVDPGVFIQISITDTGIGMTEEVMEQIFDPFFTTKEAQHGSGLGLATNFGIIKQHNGHVTVESAINQGTTFNFFLPAIDIDADTPNTDSQQPGYDLNSLSRGQETILLVDDNETARSFVCDTLEYCGYKLLTASNGNEATKIMRQTDYPIDLLLTDVIMPGLNGLELGEIAKKIYPELKIIFMSGYEDLPSTQEKMKLATNGDFLKKPLSIDLLSHTVREVLDR